MMQEKEYAIGGKTYIQRPLVIGQVKQMAGILGGLQIPRNGSVSELIDILGAKLMPAVAVVLTENAKSPRDKDIEALAAELEFTMTPEDLVRVIDDFFVLNPISSLLERIGALTENGTEAVRTLTDGLTTWLLTSRRVTSPDGTPSNGAIH